MHTFEFATATRIIFGVGKLQEAGPIAREFGRRGLVVTGQNARRAEPLLAVLTKSGVSPVTYSVVGEPTLDTVRTGLALARREQCDLVISLGGGSVLDAGKAIAGLLTNPGDPLDYVEVIGRGQPLTQPAAPFLAIPTTAGTGSEVTRNAVLGSPEHQVKVSLRSPHLLPRVALVDPALTYDLPPAVTASTGLDALTQLIEPFVSRKANPLTDALCRAGIPCAAAALRRVYEKPSDPTARQEMTLASLFGGLALANAGLGAVHGLAASIGGMLPAPHGAVCAALLPHAMAVNFRALQDREPEHPALARYQELAQLLVGMPGANPRDGLRWVRETGQLLQVPPLSRFGLTPAAIPLLVERAVQSSSMKSNPIALTSAELTEIVTKAL